MQTKKMRPQSVRWWGWRPMPWVVSVVLVVGAACSSGSPIEAAAEAGTLSETTSEPAPEVSSAAPPTTAEELLDDEGVVPTETQMGASEAGDDAPAFAETSDLVYMTVDGVDHLIDVFVPSGDGPWPVVVSLHGCCGDPEGKDIPPTVAVAEAAAAEGMMVFTPTWLTFADLPLTSETLERTAARVRCAVAFAQEHALDQGGDPATTVVDGFSAGATAALDFASEGSWAEPIPGCTTTALPEPVAGFVLGDAETWLHTAFFDGAFESDPETMQTTVARFLGPASWEKSTEGEYVVWTTQGEAQVRRLDEAAGDVDWLAARDRDGSIRSDLEMLGQLDDGVVDYHDASILLQHRLSEAGVGSTLHTHPGEHTTLDKIPEIVGYLRSVIEE